MAENPMKIVRVDNGWLVTYADGVEKRQKVYEDGPATSVGAWESSSSTTMYIRAASLAAAFEFMADRLIPTSRVGEKIRVEIKRSRS